MKFLLLLPVLLTTVICQSAPIVVPNPVTMGQPFTVYCDSSRVDIEESGVVNINRLQISRKTQLGGDSDMMVAYYNAVEMPGINVSGTKIPQTRDWNFTFSGRRGIGLGEPVFNRATMKIVWIVKNAKTQDVGEYKCYVKYYLRSGVITDTYNEVTVKAAEGETPRIPPPEKPTFKKDPKEVAKIRASEAELDKKAPTAAGPGLGCGMLVIIVALCVVLLSDIHLRSPLPEAV